MRDSAKTICSFFALGVCFSFLSSACKPVEKKVPKVTDEEQKVLDAIDQQYQK